MEDKRARTYRAALEDFRRARRRAALEGILARVTGRSAELLNFESVRRHLGAQPAAAKGLLEIPLECVVGSVGRYAEFSRTFLPRHDHGQERWARVRAAMRDGTDVPPIDVYQIGQVYFVLDGNHRVSVARQLGLQTIRAYVTQIETHVPLTPDVRPDELIIKAEYGELMARTALDRLRPQAELAVTAPGRYQQLLGEIELQRQRLGVSATTPDAAVQWYDQVYRPVVEIIRQRGVMREFPKRTETDLYLWLVEHQSELAAELQWKIDPAETALHLADEHSDRLGRQVTRLWGKVVRLLRPSVFEPGPRPGAWRETWSLEPDGDRVLFQDVLVPFSGGKGSWTAVEMAIQVARREGGKLRGLHVVKDLHAAESRQASELQAEFRRRCATAGVPGDLAVRMGKISDLVSRSAVWADVIVMHLAYRPSLWPLARLGHGIHTVIQRSSRPLLIVPSTVTPMRRAILAYDDSPKAREALFVATYLAGRWGAELQVITVAESGRADQTALDRAGDYMRQHGVQQFGLEMVRQKGSVARAILASARDLSSDLIILGGYGYSPLVEAVLPSTVDRVLRASRQPLLVCR